MEPAWLSSNAATYMLSIYVVTRASKTRVVGEHDGMLKIALCSPPVDGQANDELIAFLSKALRVPRSSVELVSGSTSRKKKISVPRTAALDSLISTQKIQ